MKPEHDPQILAARLHLRPHLIALLDGVDMPEPLRGQVADALLAGGDISRESRPEVATVDGEPVPVLVPYATLAIRHPYLGVGVPAGSATAGPSEPRIGRWVVGRGWVPVDGRGPYEGGTR